ncbi:MAG TPA: signal peptidase I [Gallionella sp.]|nr:signal peptidase I [Gallionella sp.]
MKKWLRENRGYIVFILLFAVFRTAIADWNPIPSGSMHPNLVEGDVVFVNRLAYNIKVPLTDIIVARLGEPRRGDIVTFSSPKDGTRLIKRVIALPGDRVEMRDKQLIINGKKADYQLDAQVLEALGAQTILPAIRLSEELNGERHLVQWLPDLTRSMNFGPVMVPADSYLMLGDNRDNSADSRYIGFVPRQLLIGRAERILVSAAITENWIPRTERFGKSLY